MREMQVRSLVPEDDLEEEMVILASILAGRTVHGVNKESHRTEATEHIETNNMHYGYTNTQ